MSSPQVFDKVILTELFNRSVIIECDTEEQYMNAIKKMKCPAEVIGGEDQYIKPIIDIDAYGTDIDIKANIKLLQKLLKAVLKEDFTIKYAYREPRMYNDKMKYSYRLYIQNIRMKIANIKYLFESVRLDKLITGVDYSIYKKEGLLHTPYTTKKSHNNAIVEAPPLIPVDCSIFDCCASYVKEEDCNYWDGYYQEFREGDEMLERQEYEKKMKEKQEKADDVDSEAAEKKLKTIIEKLKEARSDDYDSWTKMIWCIIGICEKSDIGMTTCSTLVHSFSQKSKKYKEREVDKFFHQSYNNQPLKQYGWTYLMKCLKEDDPDYYNEIKPENTPLNDDNLDELLMDYVYNPIDVNLNKIFVKMYSHKYRFNGETLYSYNGLRWEEDHTILKEFTTSNKVYNKLIDEYKNDKEKIKLVKKAYANMGSVSQVKKAIEIFKQEVLMRDIVTKFDATKGVIGFNNGILDLRNEMNVFRDGLPEDYITLNAKSNFTLETVEKKSEAELTPEKFIKSIIAPED